MKFIWPGKKVKVIEYGNEPAKPGDKSPFAKSSKLFLVALSAAIIAVGLITVLPAQTQTQPASAQTGGNDKYDGDCDGTETAGRCADKPFDHTFCQYPARSTNPPNGCDNSDPCDPANAAHGGSGQCSDAICPTTKDDSCLGADSAAPAVTADPNQCGGMK